MKSGIYGIYQDSNLLYIGQSCNIAKRWAFHKWQLRNNKHPNSYLQGKHNLNNKLQYVVLEDNIARGKLTSREIYYITTLKPICNFVIPSETDTWVFSEERNRKVSIGNLGKPKSVEHRKNISLARIGDKNPMYGKPAWNRGLSRYGKDNPMFGKKHSEEYKQRMSIQKGTPFDIELARKLREKGLTYREISEIVKAPRKRISKILKWNP